MSDNIFQSPRAMFAFDALSDFGAGLVQAGAPTAVPTSFAGRLGQGIVAGSQLQDQRRGARAAAQAQQDALRMRRLALATQIAQADERNRLAEERLGIDAANAEARRNAISEKPIDVDINGERQSLIQVTRNGQIVGYRDVEGNIVELPAGARLLNIATQAEQGDPGSVGGQKRVRDIKSQAAAVNAFRQKSEAFLNTLAENPNAATLAGSVARLGDRVLRDAESLAGLAGLDVGDLSPDRFSGAFEKAGLATRSAQFKRGILGLALSASAASGLGSGRALTDKDVERAISLVGGNLNNPDAIAQILRDTYRDIGIDAQTQANAFGVDIAPFEQFQAPDVSPSEMSDEQLKQALGLP